MKFRPSALPLPFFYPSDGAGLRSRTFFLRLGFSGGGKGEKSEGSGLSLLDGGRRPNI